MVLAMTVALLLAVAGPAMAAGCQAKDAVAQERTTNRGTATVAGGSSVVTTLRARGYNYSGQLGDGTEANSPRPVRVDNMEGVEAIAAGAFFSLALTKDGSVWAWGSNASDLDKTQVTGQLGEDDSTSSDEPVEVGGLGGGSKPSPRAPPMPWR